MHKTVLSNMNSYKLREQKKKIRKNNGRAGFLL